VYFDAPVDEDLAAGQPMTTSVPTPPSNPTQFVVAGKNLFFVAETAAAGLELWKSDRTSAGTMLVKDINL
jgi:ELWxxDGT repeat protein